MEEALKILQSYAEAIAFAGGLLGMGVLIYKASERITKFTTVTMARIQANEERIDRQDARADKQDVLIEKMSEVLVEVSKSQSKQDGMMETMVRLLPHQSHGDD